MEESDSKQRLNAYIYDFLVKSALRGSARTFFEETGLQRDGNGNGNGSDSRKGDVKKEIVAIDSPRSYLYEWWKIFWDLCTVRSNRNDGESVGLPAVQAYCKLWDEKKAQEQAVMAQEVRAASLQQASEDAGEYENEEVDASKLALMVNSVPLKSNLRKAPSASLKRVEKRQSKRRRQSDIREGLRHDPSALIRSGDVRMDRSARVNTVPHGDSVNAALPTQEMPSFDLQSFEYDPDFLLFTSPEAVPLSMEFPAIPGEDTCFIDNSGERALNFLNGT